MTVVEWGHGLAEGLAEDRLEVMLRRATPARTVALVGARAALGRRREAARRPWTPSAR